MIQSPPLDDLHAPLIPLLRYILAEALPRTGTVLDLACGGGGKMPLLARACGPGVRLVGLDRDADMIRAASAGHRAGWIVGDAAALPLRSESCSAAVCIAALGLFDDKLAVLRELRRALAPAGTALVLTATQAWTPVVRWPAELAARLRDAYVGALRDGHPALAAAPDLADDLAALLGGAGFSALHIRAFLLEAAAHPLEAELPLLGWANLRALLATYLAPAELNACDRLAAAADLELCTLALVGCGRARSFGPSLGSYAPFTPSSQIDAIL